MRKKVGVKIYQQAKSGGYLCTRSVIAPKVVLTAWRCVTTDPSKMYVISDRVAYTVNKVKIHPSVSESTNGLLHNDVALLFLNNKINVPILSLLTSKTVRKSDSLYIAGYGKDDNGAAGTLLKGYTKIDLVTSEYIVTVFNGTTESNSCSGDSGGPAIHTYKDRKGVTRKGIVGITSAGTTENCTSGDYTFYINTQVSTVKNFIKKNVPSVKYR